MQVKSARNKKLDNLKAIDKPVKAQGPAAMAVLKGSPKGALAALVAALEEKPNDPVLLLDAGVLLVQLRTVRWKALLDANRAHAYVALGRYSPAATAARRALQLAPWLVEAQESLAAALFCGGSPDEGVCELRAAQRRPLDDEDKQLTCAARIDRDPKDSDFGDLSTGPEGTLPHVPTPATAEIAPKYVATCAGMTDQLVPRAQQRFARLLALIPQQGAWAAKAQPASVQRTQDLAQLWDERNATPGPWPRSPT